MSQSTNKTEIMTHKTVVHVNAQHKFGADALLLAAFCNVKRAERVCDLGTGCGIIPLKLFDKGHRGVCFGVELAQQAVELFEMSIQDNKAQNIVAVKADLRTWKLPQTQALPYRHLDVVTCNPPYFTGGFVSPDAERANARHEETCTIDDVCKTAAQLLNDGGRLCMCQRPMRLADVMSAMRAAHIEPKRLQFISAQPEKEPWLFLIEGQKNRASGMRIEPTLITENPDGTRPSPMMRAIYES